jgi:hypothetical protein
VKELVAQAWGQFGKAEEEEHPPLEAATRKLVNIQQAEKT